MGASSGRGWARVVGIGLGVAATAMLTGCGADSTRAVGGGGGTPPGFAGQPFRGVVTAAGKPVTGGSVQIYAAGTAGAGAGATALLPSALTTDAQGRFNVSAGYTCPGSTAELYAIARGGTNTASSTGSRAALAFTVVLGPCSGIASGAGYTLNEATTVAAAWTLQQFATTSGSVGSSATNGRGLTNARRMAAALVDPATGTAPGPESPRNAALPTAKLNTLANLLSVCGADAGSAGCAALLAGAKDASGAPAADTLAAAVSLARGPGQAVHALYNVALGAAVYEPALAVEPPDWTLAVTYTGGGLLEVNGPTAVAIDANGNAWVDNYGGVVSAFSPVGVPLFATGVTGGGLRSSYGLAIDANSNVWVVNGDSDGSANGGLGTVTEFTTTGQFLSGAQGYVNAANAGGFNTPVGLAISPSGTVWVVNTRNGTVTQLNSSGGTTSGSSGFGSPALAFPAPIALDASGNAWVGNVVNSAAVVEISPDGKTVQPVTCCNGPESVAIDGRGFLWAANYYGDSVSRVAVTTGSVAPGGPYTGPTLTTPDALAIDGAGRVWVTSLNAFTLTELAGSGDTAPGAVLSPAGGWASDAGFRQPYAIAIDASGNLWVADHAAANVTELIGVAAPVRTPLLGPVAQP